MVDPSRSSLIPASMRPRSRMDLKIVHIAAQKVTHGLSDYDLKPNYKDRVVKSKNAFYLDFTQPGKPSLNPWKIHYQNSP